MWKLAFLLTLLAVGAEAAGLPAATLAAADAVISIPVGESEASEPDDVASLNVSVATAIVLAELRPDRPSGESDSLNR